MSLSPSVPRIHHRPVFLALLFFLSGGLIFLALVIPFFTRQTDTTLVAGAVAPRDVLAPYSDTIQSALQTEKQREEAARQVQPVYTAPDPGVGRAQLELLQATLAYMASVRADAYATPDQKLADLAALDDIRLSQDMATAIVQLNDAQWQTVQQEAMVVLEQAMRETIRPEDLEGARRSVLSLISLSLPDEQADIVATLVSAFVIPNSFYDPDLTEAAIQAAREQVAPVYRTFVANEVIVQRGQVIEDVDIEALQAFNLVETPDNWQDVAGAGLLTVTVMALFVLYLRRYPTYLQDLRALVLIDLLLLFFLLGARVTVAGHTVLPYLFPLAAFSLSLTALYGPDLAMWINLPLALLVAYGLPNALDLTLFYTLGSLFGILTLRRAQRLTMFFWAAIAIAISGSMVVVAYRLPQASTDWLGLATLTLAACFNGVAAAGISILLQYILAQPLGRVTALQLIELSRPDHPLLQFILQNAPGTYQHTVQVATLAEQAAERIGANPLLTRVGGLYHDVGKALNPAFFIENQLGSELNPHHHIDAVAAAATIIQHVVDGLELARRYRLPRQIQAFISEHHGTMMARYQYAQAVEQAGGDESVVDKSLFSYPGPRPQSRETALLMLADGCEARVRAERPKDEQALREAIRSLIENRFKIGQLDDTDLTLKDLNTITEAFTASLRGIYHPRIQYPTLEKAASEPAALPGTTGSNIPANPHDQPAS
ncbi:MAG: HD family phosphohydrolase [Chloroflexota bacterium]